MNLSTSAKIMLACLPGLLALPAPGAVYYVSTNGNDSTGADWANAYTNIQRAVNVAGDGDSIRVAGHTYPVTEPVACTNKANLAIEGGWEGSGSPGSNNPALWPTVVTRGSLIVSNRLVHVTGGSGSLLKLTLQGGYVAGDGALGAGLLISNSVLTLGDCLIQGNVITSGTPVLCGGAGLYAVGSTLLITNCVILSNRVTSIGQGKRLKGAGCFLDGGSAEIVDSTISSNRLMGLGGAANLDFCYGGGVCAAGAAVTIRRCFFDGNLGWSRYPGSSSGQRSHLYGGALYVTGAVALVRDSVFRRQRLDSDATATANQTHGAGLCGDLGSVLNLANILVVLNTAVSETGARLGDGLCAKGGLVMTNATVADNGGEGVWVRATNAVVSVSDSILWNNGDDLVNFPTNGAGVLSNVWYSDTQDGDNAGAQGCVSTNPVFERGYFLATNSPCVDIGGDSAVNLGLAAYPTRADGVPDSGVVDLGYHPRAGLAPWNLYVLGAGDDGNAGTNWSTALRSITRAISLAREGSHIHVGEGWYTNLLETFPLRLSTFWVDLLGTNAESCIVDAAGASTRVVEVTSSQPVRIENLSLRNGRVVTTSPRTGAGVFAVGTTLTLNACRIESNSIPVGGESYRYEGCGVYARLTNLEITNCLIANNIVGDSTSRGSRYYGAGCMVSNGTTLIVDSSVTGNRLRGRGFSGIGDTIYGGGIYAAGPMTLRHSRVNSNHVSAVFGNLYGGGVYAASALRIEGTELSGNQGYKLGAVQGGDDVLNMYGGGVFAAGALAVSNSSLAGNVLNASLKGVVYGGGIRSAAETSLQNVLLAANRVMASNLVDNFGGGLSVVGALAMTNVTVASNGLYGVWRSAAADIPVSLVSSIFWYNAGDDLVGFPTNEAGVISNVWYCDLEDGGNLFQQGCFSADPRFADPAADYHLRSQEGRWTAGGWVLDAVSSPCIDRGDPAGDYTREPMRNGARVNQGAYGNTEQASKTWRAPGSIATFR